MKSTLKNTLTTLTILSTGLFLLSAGTASAGYKKPKAKDAVAEDPNFKQYPMLGELKEDVNAAMKLHQTAASLLSDKVQLEEYQDSIDKYYEIKRRLNKNIQCNINLMRDNYTDGNSVWEKISAYAEDTASKLLAEASDSLGDADASNELKNLENSMDSGDTSATSASASSSDSKYSSINENTTDEQAMAMVNAGTKEAEDTAAEAENNDMDMDEAAAYGKIRWDVGFSILKDIYTYPRRWGILKKRFSPWVDQKRIYDVYLKEHYEEMEKSYVFFSPLGVKLCNLLPKPTMSSKDSYLPEDYYNGEIPDIKASSVRYDAKTASADERWCGQTNGKKNICNRVNKGSLYTQHVKYVAALKACQLKEGVVSPDMEAPYLPQFPLPPWRESVYIMNVKKDIPEIASDLPDPWFRVTQNIENYTENGELSNLVERHKNTVRFRSKAYDHDTYEIKTDSKGNPKIPIPLVTNRIGSYLALVAAKEEQKPIKDRAVVSIKTLNETIVKTLQEEGYTVPNADSFDLRNSKDYKLALQKLGEFQDKRIASAKSKMNKLSASFGGALLPSVKKILTEETRTMDAMQKDSEFLITVTRDNAAKINSLLQTAVADATANENYKDNVNQQMEEASKIPPVGCPVQ